MNYLPILIDIRNQDVLVVGEGHLAARKARGALRAGAKVTFVGKADMPALTALVADPQCRQRDEAFHPDMLRGMRLVFAATEDDALAHAVSRAAREAGIPVNAADRTALCSFIMPATVTRGPIVIAVSSGGDAPILTRSLRAHLETMMPAELGKLAAFVAERREQVMEALPDFDARRRFWDRFMDSPVPELISDGDLDGARKGLDAALAVLADPAAEAGAGLVSIIGCGPGDPDLLTFKALRLMQQADVALVDAAVPPGIAERVRRDADIETTGPDDDVAGRIADASGKSVARLGPGDFAATAQGKAEIEALAALDIRAIAVAGVATSGD